MNIFLTSLILCISLSYQATKKDFDNIKVCSYYILKEGTAQNNKPHIKACEIKTRKIAEQLFGSCSNASNFKDELFDENMTVVKYNDGLELWISDDYKNLFTFKITSSNYSLLFENGKEIKTGMTLDDFKYIFPKSYSLRSISNWSNQIGKTKINVFFSFINAEHQLEIADTWIIFTFDNMTKALEEFQSFVPG